MNRTGKIIKALVVLTFSIINAQGIYTKAENVVPSQSGIDWGDARWLKATDTPNQEGTLTTKIELDLKPVKGNPAVIFGWTADRAYFQWQIISGASDNLILRRCVRTFTDTPPYEDVNIDGIKASDIKDKKIKLRIEASGNSVTTYINDKWIDKYKCSRIVPVGKAGIRVEPGEEAVFDNFSMTLSHPNGNSRTIVSEDFSTNGSLYFMDAVISDGECHVSNSTKEYKLLTIDESYPTFYRYFKAEKGVASATLYASALGIYDVWINGMRVGTANDDGTVTYDELKPGWTDYNKRVAYYRYDVTSLCQQGENSIGALVTPGWLGGQISRSQYKFPLERAFMAKLEVVYSDGTKEMIVTDDSWSTEKYSHILKSDIYHGETVDGRRELPWISKAKTLPCKPQLYDYPGAVEPCYGPTVRAMDALTLHPVKTVVYSGIESTTDLGKVKELYSTTENAPINIKAGETAIVDFGQNCAALPRLHVKGKQATRVHLRFGEMLNDSGERSRGNDGPAGSLYTANLRAAKAELYYTLRGDSKGESYIPTTTFFGYRYCEITATDDIVIDRIETVPLSSSHQITGNVVTDNEDVNRLFSNVLWSQLSNFISVPTDCPQRDERLGWTADAQLFSTTAMYNADVAEFYRKWLCDIRDSQREDGAYSDVSPLSLVKYGSAGWSDAGIVVPWQIYMLTGDVSAVSEHYESMERYMSWLSTLDDDGLKYPGAYTTYGDLFAADGADKRFVSQAYYYYDAVLMSKMSKLLSSSANDDYHKKSQSYSSLADAIKQEMQSLYFNEQGLINVTQSGCVISLWFGLYADDSQRQSIADTLVRLIRNKGYRMDTGFISTAYILQTLSDNGYDDVAYALLTQHDYPSWMFMVDNGATTMWENWYCYKPDKGFCDVNRNSFNHFGLGSFGSWMYSNMAGIKPCEEQPGFEKVIFSPSIDSRESCASDRKVSRVKAVKGTARGDISAEWLSDDDTLTYDITVPTGTEGEVRLPVVSLDIVVYEGSQPAELSDRIKSLGYTDGRKIYSVKSGEYHFSLSTKQMGIETPESHSISIWPNPAKTEINISCDGDITDVCVISLSGEVVAQYPYSVSSIDVSYLTSGFYIAKITTPKGTHIKKFIKI